jgi:hypothetical protein
MDVSPQAQQTNNEDLFAAATDPNVDERTRSAARECVARFHTGARNWHQEDAVE